MIANAFKNLAAVTFESDYSFKQADKLKEAAKNASVAVVAAPAGGKVAAKVEEKVEEPEADVDMGNLFGDDYKQLDLSSRLDIGQIMGWKQDLQLTFDVWNLGKSKQRSYFQFANATFTEYEPGRTYLVGLRAKF